MTATTPATLYNVKVIEYHNKDKEPFWEGDVLAASPEEAQALFVSEKFGARAYFLPGFNLTDTVYGEILLDNGMPRTKHNLLKRNVRIKIRQIKEAN